jgi:hypothetical protein
MTAESLLITYVQIGVAISGFSGIVVSLGNRGQGEWSHRDRQLLYALLGMSGGCTLLSALPLILASTGLAEPTVWSASSGCSVILQLVLMVVRARQVGRDADTLARERWVLAGAYAGGVVSVAAQLVNCVWLGVAWPHLATITFYLAVSFIVFVRLVQPEARP